MFLVVNYKIWEFERSANRADTFRDEKTEAQDLWLAQTVASVPSITFSVSSEVHINDIQEMLSENVGDRMGGLLDNLCLTSAEC